jgi:hypothetical protein
MTPCQACPCPQECFPELSDMQAEEAAAAAGGGGGKKEKKGGK